MTGLTTKPFRNPAKVTGSRRNKRLNLRTLKVKKARSQKIIQRNSYEQDNRD